MRKILLLLISATLSLSGFAQLTGTKTIPGDYLTIAAAVTDLNTQGVGAGGVTFNVVANHTESISGPISLTATGTSANPIVFQKDGALGANPLVTRTDAGSIITSTFGGQGDAIIIIEGSDYVTFDGIDVAASDQGIEYGYYLRKASTDDGCKFVIIKNANITMTKGTSQYVVGIYSSNNDAASLVSSAVGITVTSVGGRNESVTIAGNTISNVFAGILLRGFNHTTAPRDFFDHDFTVGENGAGNIIQNYAGNASGTAYGVYMIYHNNLSIGYNTINNTAGGGSGFTSTGYGIFTSTAASVNIDIIHNNVSLISVATTSLMHGINNAAGSTAASNTVTIANNTVSNCDYSTATSAAFTGIVNSGSAATVDVNNNVVSNNTLAGTGTFTGIDGGAPTNVNIYNNTVNNNQKTGASGSMFLTRAGTAIVSYYSNNVYDNSFTASSGTASCIIYGYYNLGSPTVENIYDNNIYNLTVAGTNTGTSSILNGIHTNTTSSAVKNIYDNSIRNFSALSGNVNGIAQFLGTDVKIYRNEIFNLSNETTTTTAATMCGISISSGTVYAYNNFISDLRTPASAAIDAIRGINITSTTTNSNVGLYFNTIYLDAEPGEVPANFGTSGIFHTYSATATTASLDMRNNIIVNVSQPKGTGSTVAFRRSAATNLLNYNEISNNNDFYAGTPGANNLIYFDGTNADQTIAAFQTRVSPRETVSVSQMPPFEDVAGTPYDLRLKTNIPTQLESGGQRITAPIAITEDYFGTIRALETGYSGTGVAPDIGAHEDEFQGLDLVPPLISYTPFENTASTTARTLVVTVSDASGVPATAPGWPHLYWKKTGDVGYTAVAPSSVIGNDYTFVFGAGTSLGDIVDYYIVAQDLATPTPNVGAFPSGGAGGFTINPPAAVTPPTTPSSYTVIGSISGTFTVGASRSDYATLTGDGGLFADINSKVVVGDIIAEIISDITEPGTHALNQWAEDNGPWSLTIKPDAATMRTLSGTFAGGLIRLNGADRVTIDGSYGGDGRYLTLQNLSLATNTAAIQLMSLGNDQGATDNTIKNSVIMAGEIGTTTSLHTFGIFVGGTTISNTGTGADNDNLAIENNIIKKARYAIYARAATVANTNDGLVITGNEIGSADPNEYVTFRGLDIAYAQGPLVSENYIFNLKQNLSASNAAMDFGAGVNNAQILANRIEGVYSESTSGWGAFGINFSSSASVDNNLIANNSVTDIRAVNYSTGSTGFNAFGIRLVGGTNTKVYYNSVNLFGDITIISGTPTQPNSAAFLVTSTAVTGLELVNNVFVNTQTFVSGTPKAYSVWVPASYTGFATVNHNDYYGVGGTSPNPTVYFVGRAGSTDYATLLDWQGYTTQDVNSISNDPLFNSNTNLQPQNGSPLLGAGTPITGINTDIIGAARSVTAPTVGAYETESDSAPPSIVYTPLDNTTSTSARTLVATITDASGVPSIAPGWPHLYWKKTGDVGFTGVAPSGVNGNEFTFEFGSGVVGLDIVEYYIVAQDGASPINIGSFPSAGADGFTANPPAASTPPSNPSSYSIISSLSGTYTIGTGGDFETLTGNGGLFQVINSNALSGNVIAEVISNLSETGIHGLNEWSELGDGNYTLKIKPGDALNKTISGDYAGGLIRLNGADRVTIDGSFNMGAEKYLAFQNLSSAINSAAIQIISLGTDAGAVNNTIKNCNIAAGSNVTTSTFGIYVGGATISTSGTGAHNNNLTIENNTITKAYYGIYVSGVATTGVTTGLSITDNTIGADLADDYVSFRGIFLGRASGTVSNNTIYNIIISTSVITRGIEVSTGVVDTEILGNHIYNVQNLTTSLFVSGQGISLSTGTATSNILVANNSLHGFSGRGSGTASNNMWGIIILTGGGYNIYYNSINMYNNGIPTGSTDLNGCIYIAAAASNLKVVNNVFSATGDVGNSTTLGFMYGIYSLAANTAYLSINYNDYFVSGTRSMLGYIGAANRSTLAAWQTATGQDANSLAADPVFATNTNLQPLPGSPLLGAGSAIAGIDVDILDADRDDTSPSIGAYENAAPVGTLAGTVSEATRGVIEGAVITIGNKSGVTDEFGAYLIQNILIGSYTVTCEAESYLTAIANDVVIVENQTTTQNFVLDFGQISVTPSSLEFYLMPGGSDDALVNISNPAGTGPLTWSASTTIWNVDARGMASNSQIGEFNNEESEINPDQTPFAYIPSRNFLDVQGGFSVGSPGYTQYGVATDGEFIYTCAWNSTSFGKYTMSGAYIGSFTITGVGSLRDLTYDGQYFYGSPLSNAIYKMDFTNQLLVETINITPSGNTVRGIAYDATNDAFWVTSTSFSGPLKLISRAGATLQTLATTAANFTGLAWDNVTAGGPFLWAYTQSEPANNTLVQINLTTGDPIQSIDIAASGALSETSIAGGLVFTDLLAPGLTALMGIAQNDAVWILEISSWLSIDITSGVIAPAGDIDVSVSVDATGLDEGIYNGKVLINHNGQEVNRGMSEVAVTMYVFGACPKPYNLNASNVTATSSLLTWTQFSGAEKWNVEIGLPGFVPGTGNSTDEYAGVEEASLLALGLDPETTYTFFVQASCEEDVSSWAGPYQFTTLELCPTPTAPLASGITATSANLGWTENGSAATWAIEYGIAPYTFTGTPSLTVTTNPYTVTGLTPNTPYQFKIRAVCGGDESNWSSTGSFTTLCASVTMPFTEDFTGLLATEIPECWSKADLGTTNWGAALTGNAGGTSPEMRFYFSPSFTGVSRLITPPISTGGKLDLMVRMDQYLDDYTSNDGEYIALEYSVDGGTNWTEFWQYLCTADYGPVYDLIPFTLPPATDEFLIAFKFSGYSFNIDNWYFDNVLIDELKYPVTFNVDVTTIAGFNHDTEVIYIAGDFPGATWNEPGSNPNLQLSRVGLTNVYTITLDLLPASYQYKYFRNAGWGGGEWDGGPNRDLAVTGVTETEDVFGGDITFANLQWPPDGTITEGGSFTAYGQAFIPNGITGAAGAAFGLEAWVGVSTDNTNPAGWSTWVPATFNSQAGDNDEFQADIASGLTPGTYYYAYRYRFGQVYGEYLYGGYSGGFWDGTTNVSGVLTVNSAGPPSYRLVAGAVDDCLDATDEVEIVGASVENGAVADIRSGGIITATDFEVKSGGTAYLTAATSITLGNDVLITPGATGLFLAKIDTFDPCVLPLALVASVEEGIPDIPATASFFKVFPNPTTGSFKLELTGVEESSSISVEIFGMMGERVFQDQLFGSMLYEFDLTYMPKGIYFIRVLKGDEMGIEKVIKQ